MERLLGNWQGFLEGKGSIARSLRMNGFCLQSLLLILLASVTSTSNAGAIHDAAKSGDLEQIQRLRDGVKSSVICFSAARISKRETQPD